MTDAVAASIHGCSRRAGRVSHVRGSFTPPPSARVNRHAAQASGTGAPRRIPLGSPPIAGTARQAGAVPTAGSPYVARQATEQGGQMPCVWRTPFDGPASPPSSRGGSVARSPGLRPHAAFRSTSVTGSRTESQRPSAVRTRRHQAQCRTQRRTPGATPPSEGPTGACPVFPPRAAPRLSVIDAAGSVRTFPHTREERGASARLSAAKMRQHVGAHRVLEPRERRCVHEVTEAILGPVGAHPVQTPHDLGPLFQQPPFDRPIQDGSRTHRQSRVAGAVGSPSPVRARLPPPLTPLPRNARSIRRATGARCARVHRAPGDARWGRSWRQWLAESDFNSQWCRSPSVTICPPSSQ